MHQNQWNYGFLRQSLQTQKFFGMKMIKAFYLVFKSIFPLETKDEAKNWLTMFSHRDCSAVFDNWNTVQRCWCDAKFSLSFEKINTLMVINSDKANNGAIHFGWFCAEWMKESNLQNSWDSKWITASSSRSPEGFIMKEDIGEPSWHNYCLHCIYITYPNKNSCFLLIP